MAKYLERRVEVLEALVDTLSRKVGELKAESALVKGDDVVEEYPPKDFDVIKPGSYRFYGTWIEIKPDGTWEDLGKHVHS